MPRRLPPGYRIKKVYLVSCSRCNEDITRTLSGDDVLTREEAEVIVFKHQQEWHA